MERVKKSSAALLIAVLFAAASAAALISHIPIQDIMENYSFNVLVILISMELFTNLIAETGIMQLLSVRLATLSGGKKRASLAFFGALMFLISSFLNNITAVMIVLPVMFVLLKTIDADEKYVCTFFAVILALSNTGGAASPVGDFPAVIIMTSGITSFSGYLIHAFPLFAATSVILAGFWITRIRREDDDGSVRMLAVSCLKSQYKNIQVRYDVLKPLILILAGMFFAWSFLPQDIVPPEVISVLGYAGGCSGMQSERHKGSAEYRFQIGSDDSRISLSGGNGESDRNSQRYGGISERKYLRYEASGSRRHDHYVSLCRNLFRRSRCSGYDAGHRRDLHRSSGRYMRLDRRSLCGGSLQRQLALYVVGHGGVYTFG